MKKIMKISWNLLLIVAVLFIIVMIFPKVTKQFERVDNLPEGSFKTRVQMGGYIGIAILASATVFSLSVASPFWGRVSVVWRLVFGAFFVLCVAGIVLSVKIDMDDMGFANWGDHIAFAVSNFAFLFSIVVFGRGYPQLFIDIWRFARKGRNAEQISSDNQSTAGPSSDI